MRFPKTAAFLAAALIWGSAWADTTIPDAARAAFNKAELAREEGRLADALKLYREAIDAHGVYEAAHAGYLAALRGLGDTSPARPLYAELIDKHQTSVELQVFKAAVSEPETGLPALQKLIEDYPGNKRAWIELARMQLHTGAESEAEDTLKDLLKKDSEFALARVLLGDVFLNKRKYTKARKEYKEALSAERDFVPAHLKLAWCEHLAGNTNQALQILGTLVGDNQYPNLVAAHWLLAVIRTELDKLDDALQSIERILSIAKDDFNALIAKGQLLLRQGKPAEAAKVFTRATEIKPDSSDALFCLGWAYEKAADAPEIQDAQKKERLARAVEAYEKCANVDPGVRPRDSLGFVYLLGDLHQEAVTQFRRAKDINPEYAPALNNLGLAQDIADNRAEAKKRYEYVLSKIDKKNVRARVMLALDLWLDGSPPKAIRELQRALKVDPEDDLAWTFLGDIYVDSKKIESAIKSYKQAVKINEGNFIAWFHMGLAYDDYKRKFEEAEKCYEKAHQATVNPPVELLLRLAEINDEELLNQLEKALQYYQAYVEAGGDVEWVPDRVEELKEMLGK